MKKKLLLFILLGAGLVAAQSCKSLFKSDYAVLSATDITSLVEEKYPEMTRRQIAQNDTIRKKVIDDYKKSFALAQAAEEAGIDKSDEFNKIMEFGVDQMLATRYIQRHPDQVVSKEEWEAHYAAHKNQFDSHLKLIADFSKQALTDTQKEQFREVWSQTAFRAEKARQAKLDKEPGFAILVKFGRAEILANLYVRSIEEKNKLTDEGKKKYLSENPGADPDKLKEKAQGLLDRVKKGEDFEKIAREFSDDPVSKADGGDLGWFARGAMDPAFESAAFALQKGQTTVELVKSRFGYHIIRVEDRRTSSPKTDKARQPEIPAHPPEPPQEPKEEIRARHILVDTTAFEQFETQQIKDSVKRDLDAVMSKYKVEAPADFAVNLPGSDRNPIPGGGGPGGPGR